MSTSKKKVCSSYFFPGTNPSTLCVNVMYSWVNYSHHLSLTVSDISPEISHIILYEVFTLLQCSTHKGSLYAKQLLVKFNQSHGFPFIIRALFTVAHTKAVAQYHLNFMIAVSDDKDTRPQAHSHVNKCVCGRETRPHGNVQKIGAYGNCQRTRKWLFRLVFHH